MYVFCTSLRLHLLSPPPPVSPRLSPPPGMIESFLPRAAADEVTNTPFTVGGFLRNFAIFRVVVDIVFYCGHRAMHVYPWLYRNVHKRHHEHYTTNLRTNYHFTAPDLFVESALPIFAGIGVLRGVLGIALSRFEIHLMMTCVGQWRGGRAERGEGEGAEEG